MKTILIVAAFFLSFSGFSQVDANGNPVFNSVTLKEEMIKDFQFSSNYYTLKNNIENKGSSVYISNKPTLGEIEHAATSLASDFFLALKKQTLLNVVILVHSPARQFMVINPTTGKSKNFDCTLSGDITENRANELVKEKYDPKARIVGSQLFFNGKKMAIISNKEISTAVLQLIEREKLSEGEASEVKIRSEEDIKALILEESKDGGRLDFFSGIVGHEDESVQVKPRVFTTKSGLALYKWGRANFELGTNTVEDAVTYWASLKGRQANEKEREYITLGFNKGLEN